MGITDSLATARDAVKDAALPDEWQVPAFIEVLRHLMSAEAGSGQTVSSKGGGSSNNAGNGADGKSNSTADTGAARLSHRVGVDEQKLLDVFDFTEEGVTLHVASSRIAGSKSKATQEVALLIVAARQGSGLDAGWTSAEHVREALQHYNKYDQSNFSQNMKGVDHAFNSRGKGPSLELRLTQPGWESAIQLVRTVAGASE